MTKVRGLSVVAILILSGLSLSGCGLLFGRPPVALIEASPGVGKPPLTVNFDGTGSYDPDGAITAYKWDFGDGTAATGSRVSHIYSGAGFYLVSLTVKDNSGKRGKDARIIEVYSFTPVAVPTGDGPIAAVAADFNRDGNQDLVVADQFADGATILLGNGDGTFLTEEMKLGDGPIYLEAADLDKDGLLDLVVANLIESTVSILLGNGDGSFKRFKEQSVGNGPISLAVVDLDNDGNLDLAVVCDFSDEILLLWGEGNGSFTKGNSLKDERLENLKSITFGDFDRDGNPDLAAVAADSANVGIFLGSGERDFRAPLLFPTGPGPHAIRRADLDGDGRDDLVIAEQGELALLLGWGVGSQMFHPTIHLGTGGTPSSVALLDLDGDERLDLAVTDHENNRVSILIGHGDGTFEPPLEFDVGSGPTAVLGLDVNNDGRLDLATTNQDDDTLTLLLNATP
ncbi:MAG: FG-GAP-like repeat-containing protein [Candidatus Bipolaricaulia bacterium]